MSMTGVGGPKWASSMSKVKRVSRCRGVAVALDPESALEPLPFWGGGHADMACGLGKDCTGYTMGEGHGRYHPKGRLRIAGLACWVMISQARQGRSTGGWACVPILDPERTRGGRGRRKGTAGAEGDLLGCVCRLVLSDGDRVSSNHHHDGDEGTHEGKGGRGRRALTPSRRRG